MEQTNELVITENESMANVIDRIFLGGKYCSFKAYYGNILKELSKTNDEEEIDEKLYFMALEKAGIVMRGKTYTLPDDEVPTFHIDKDGSLHPPKQKTDLMLAEMNEENVWSVSTGIYATKRRSFGFNCENDELMKDLVENPVIKILKILNSELIDAKNVGNTKEEKKALRASTKAMGITITGLKELRKDTILARTF